MVQRKQKTRHSKAAAAADTEAISIHALVKKSEVAKEVGDWQDSNREPGGRRGAVREPNMASFAPDRHFAGVENGTIDESFSGSVSTTSVSYSQYSSSSGSVNSEMSQKEENEEEQIMGAVAVKVQHYESQRPFRSGSGHGTERGCTIIPHSVMLTAKSSIRHDLNSPYDRADEVSGKAPLDLTQRERVKEEPPPGLIVIERARQCASSSSSFDMTCGLQFWQVCPSLEARATSGGTNQVVTRCITAS